MKKYAFGVDLGGTTVKLGLFKTDGDLVEKWEIPTRTEEKGRYILADIAEELRARVKSKNLSLSGDIEGTGIGVPGPVLEDGVVNTCVNLGWGVFNVAKELSQLLGDLPVRVGNDADVAALGEQWRGAGQGYQNLVMVTLGTGVGGGIILGGKILPGSSGAAGEIGHMLAKRDEKEPCNCGKYGCLEQYASATGIARLAKKKSLTWEKATTLKIQDTNSCKEVVDCAKAGDELALSSLQESMRYLGEALARITCVVDPEAIVIGGGVSKAGDFLLEMIEKYYTPVAFHATRNVVFKLASLGNDGGIFGAARMVLL